MQNFIVVLLINDITTNPDNPNNEVGTVIEI